MSTSFIITPIDPDLFLVQHVTKLFCTSYVHLLENDKIYCNFVFINCFNNTMYKYFLHIL